MSQNGSSTTRTLGVWPELYSIHWGILYCVATLYTHLLMIFLVKCEIRNGSHYFPEITKTLPGVGLSSLSSVSGSFFDVEKTLGRYGETN